MLVLLIMLVGILRLFSWTWCQIQFFIHSKYLRKSCIRVYRLNPIFNCSHCNKVVVRRLAQEMPEPDWPLSEVVTEEYGILQIGAQSWQLFQTVDMKIFTWRPHSIWDVHLSGLKTDLSTHLLRNRKRCLSHRLSLVSFKIRFYILIVTHLNSPKALIRWQCTQLLVSEDMLNRCKQWKTSNTSILTEWLIWTYRSLMKVCLIGEYLSCGEVAVVSLSKNFHFWKHMVARNAGGLSYWLTADFNEICHDDLWWTSLPCANVTHTELSVNLMLIRDHEHYKVSVKTPRGNTVS